MAFFAAEAALKVVSPFLIDALMTSTAVGGIAGGSMHNSVPTPRNPSATPGNTTAPPAANFQTGSDGSMRVSLRDANISPGTIMARAREPVHVPAPPTPRIYDENGNYVSGGSSSSRYIRSVDQIDDGISEREYDEIMAQEYRLMADFFETTPDAIARIPELQRLALGAVTGVGPVFSSIVGRRMAQDIERVMRSEDDTLRKSYGPSTSYMSEAGPIARALHEAKGDYEMSLGSYISDTTFANRLEANGVSMPRIARAWERVSGALGNNTATRAVFRKWVVQRLVPGAAGSALSYVLEQGWNAMRGPRNGVPGVAAPSETRNENVDASMSYDDARGRMLDYEISQVLRGLDVGDEAASVIGSASWKDRLRPLADSVQWVVNSSSDTGVSDFTIPHIPYQVRNGDLISFPGDGIFTKRLSGHDMTERIADTRATKKATRLNVPEVFLSTESQAAADPPPSTELIIPGPPKANGLGVRNFHRTGVIFPSVHEQARTMDHLSSQSYDTTMVPSVPSYVSPATSSAAPRYTGENRGYKNQLDSAPNVVGIGFDTSQTERRLVEDAAVSDGSSAATTPPPVEQSDATEGAQTTNPRDSEAKRDTRSVPVAEISNPVFSNVGTQVPQRPLESIPSAPRL